MNLVFGAALIGLGVACILMRRSVIGVMIGFQLLMIGATSLFVLSGFFFGEHARSFTFGLFILLSSATQLAGGLALSGRLFYLRKNANLEEVNEMKH